MRKLYLVLLLPFLMLLAQQGALCHELSHLAESSHQTAQGHPKQHPGGTLCETCLNFAHIVASATPNVPILRLPTQLRHQLVATAWTHMTESVVPAPRSRGPPIVF